MRERSNVMSTILSKKDMSEEDIKLQYIISAVTAKWDIGKATLETQIKEGKRFAFPLSPLAGQKRIVTKMENCFRCVSD